MDENIVWRTNKYGHKFPIKQTNNYMNEKIRDSIIKVENDKKYKIPDEQINAIYNRRTNKYAERRFFISEIKPDDFLKLTTDSESIKDVIKETQFKLDSKILDKNYMFLQMNMKTGQITGHEGRHRMVALKNAGYQKAEIIIFPEYGTMEGFNQYNYKIAKNQINPDYFSTRLEKIMPVNEEYIRKIKGVD